MISAPALEPEGTMAVNEYVDVRALIQHAR